LADGADFHFLALRAFDADHAVVRVLRGGGVVGHLADVRLQTAEELAVVQREGDIVLFGGGDGG
jgi:hypothetical protein